MITLDRVSKTFAPSSPTPIRAVADISLAIHPGQVTGLLGPNGAGKSTLIRMIVSLLTPSRGSISILGHDSVLASARARALIGYLPESAPSYPEMRVADFLDYRARLFSLPRRERATAIDSAIDRCELREVRRRRIGQLSKGFRQRVGLASAILHNPPVLILDEPASGLDPSQILHMRSLIADLAASPARDPAGNAVPRVVLLSSHILPEVEHTCDRILIIARGRLRADGSPEVLLSAHAGSHATYVIEAAPANAGAPTDPAAIAGMLRIAGVASIEPRAPLPGSRFARLIVSASHEAPDLREPIAAAAQAAGLVVRELTRQRPSLESVFVHAVEAPDAAAASDAAAKSEAAA